jgi:hypothetical protein
VVTKSAATCMKFVRNARSKTEKAAQNAAQKAAGSAVKVLWKGTAASFKFVMADRKAKRAAKGKKRSAL